MPFTDTIEGWVAGSGIQDVSASLGIADVRSFGGRGAEVPKETAWKATGDFLGPFCTGCCLS